MALSRAEVQHVARLARLRLPPDEEARFAEQLGRIVDYIDHIREAEAGTGDGEASAVPAPALRECDDREAPGLPRESVIANAPRAHGAFVAVPRVLAGDD